jgi:hypothetical protein
MSIGVFGIFHITNDMITNEQMSDLSFFIAKKALELRIWVNQGVNVSERSKYYINIIRGRSELEKIFELADNPMDSNAECLFGADGIEVYVCGKRVDKGESLISRMITIQHFLKAILGSGFIHKIELYVNIESGDEFEVKDLNVEDFCEVVSEVYKNEDGWTPNIKCVITDSTI